MNLNKKPNIIQYDLMIHIRGNEDGNKLYIDIHLVFVFNFNFTFAEQSEAVSNHFYFPEN